RICAFIGLVALCLGILLGRNEPMVVCGIVLAIYAVFSIQAGYTVGWIFLILNILFAVGAANALYSFY
ncbi:MFS transporter, partial [Francisella tularensis subsp. holarctica]|nr:MFS transporter [Francisella tularensis subsp. holarctica]